MRGQLFESLERRTLFDSAIAGLVYDDLNGNGRREANEPGRAGAIVYIDANKNGLRDKNEQTGTTNADGFYSMVVPGGIYRVRLHCPEGRRLSAPAAIFHDVDSDSKGAARSFDFADTTTAVIRGTVFTDLNQDTLRQSNEPGLGGWTVYIDKNNNGQYEPGTEKVRVTNSRGDYRFAGLTPGTYRLRIVQQNDFARTNPLSGLWVVRNLGAAQSVSARNFGQRLLDDERP